MEYIMRVNTFYGNFFKKIEFTNIYVFHSQLIQVNSYLQICIECLCVPGTVLRTEDSIVSALVKQSFMTFTQMRNSEGNRYMRVCWTSDLESSKSPHKYKWMH